MVELSLQIRQRVAGGGRVSTMELVFGLSSEVALDVRVAVTGGIEKPAILEWTAERPLISVTAPQRVVMVGFVPVVHQFHTESVPHIRFDELGVELASTFRFETEQRVTYSSTDGWSAMTNRSERPLVTGIALPVVSMTSTGVAVEHARLRGELQTKVQVILYGIAGPELRLKPGVEGVLDLTPGACPNRRIVGDIPFSFGASIDRRVSSSYGRMFPWIEDVELSLPTWTIGSASWPKDCTQAEHRTAWTGIGGAVADITYEVGAVDLIYVGAFERQAGAGRDPESRTAALLVFDLSAKMNQDLSLIPETFENGGFDDIIRNQLCSAIDGDTNDLSRARANLLLVDPVTREIVSVSSLQSGPSRESESLNFVVTGHSRDDNDDGLCTALELEFERRMMWVRVDLEVAERIERNGVWIVLAPQETFFPALTTFDFIAASPELWERQDWSVSVSGLPVLRPE